MMPGPVSIPSPAGPLSADLALPSRPHGLVIFAHGMGSGRHSRRNQDVAAELRRAGMATLLMDLLTPQEQAGAESRGRPPAFDLEALAARMEAAIDWSAGQPGLAGLPLGLFGGSTGAAVALAAAAQRRLRVLAVVCRGGRTDLAGHYLHRVSAPVRMIVGGGDPLVLELNRESLDALGSDSELRVVPGAGHLFAEPGSLEAVARMSAEWFKLCFEGQPQEQEARHAGL